VVAEIRSLNPRIPIIFMTGYLSATAGKVILDDVAEILPKPLEFDALTSAVQRLLPSSRTARA
jgi:DNA-binding NtrC family response regulator